MSESAAQRERRERQRLLFDGVAEEYRESRQGYPEQVVRWIAETAGLGAGAPVLEVGCGTGQLTAELARLRLRVTAIDIGPHMVSVARRQVPDAGVTFLVSSFEELEAPEGSFDLIVSATAAHWIDPEVLGERSARLLRSGGWLAIASTAEDYDEPVRSALLAAWVRRSSDGGAWLRATPPTAAELIAASGLFEPAVTTTDRRRLELTPERVLQVERTRAVYLDYDPGTRDSFDAELRQLLSGLQAVPATIRTEVTMATLRRPSPR